jgi:HK97 family phage major capsid protein
MEFNENEKAMLVSLKEQTTELITEKTKNLISQDGFNDAIGQLNKQHAENQDALNIIKAAQEAQGLKLTEMANTKSENTPKDMFKHAYKENEEQFKSMAQSGRGSFSFDLSVNKASADMSLGNYSGGYVGISSLDPQVGGFVKREPYLREIINASTIDSQYVTWIDQANQDGTTGSTAEGGAKNKIDFDLVERKLPVECINAYVTVSKQALADFGQMRALINEELRSEVELNLDAQILTGSGTTPALKGIQTYATAYANTGFAALVYNPTELDVLNIMQAQVAAAKGKANYALMHPTDVAKLRSLRRPTTGAAGDYSWAFQWNPVTGLMMYNGLSIIENTGVTANTAYVIDSRACKLAMREDFNVTVGLDGSNFTKNQVTILGEMRAAHYVKENDKVKLIYCSSLSSAITALIHA